uniref:Uncharacterized protein n=1 Tax=Pipistrellus kuhlii TaxID=59472 RepID=A0A7J7U818_PIPKU|nr:hypothetical protein mPipKuh1_009193 [Pipistrellus kuhlii]
MDPFHLASSGRPSIGGGGGPGWQAGSPPLLLSRGTWEGALAPGGVRAPAPLAGVTSTFPGRTRSPRARCLRSGIPALGPQALCQDREPPVPTENLRAGLAGLARLPGPSPGFSVLFSEPRRT